LTGKNGTHNIYIFVIIDYYYYYFVIIDKNARYVIANSKRTFPINFQWNFGTKFIYGRKMTFVLREDNSASIDTLK
jgi:hypothetical protein